MTHDEDKKNKKKHHYTPTKTNNVNKTSTHPQTTAGKHESNIVYMRKSYRTSHMWFDNKSPVSPRRCVFHSNYISNLGVNLGAPEGLQIIASVI
jgi:hypothetical protein